MVLKYGYSRATVDHNIALMISEGYPRNQAVAASLNHARQCYFKRHPKGFPPWHLRTPAEKTRTGRNPVPPSSRASGIKKNPASRRANLVAVAADLYERFSGHEAEEVGTVDKPVIPDVLVAIGEVDGILYSTIRDGVLEKYIHRFKKQSRPLLAVSPDEKQLLMLGGAFDFTERGIVDSD